jgi:hypothetical protein
VKANMVTAERLHALAELYQQGHVSDLMDRTLEKLLHHEAEPGGPFCGGLPPNKGEQPTASRVRCAPASKRG